ncbi:unnamed protein product [Clonostachys solani]|uniref:Uncharacterized protein n=1 Tax=Clonostachys solani TaxID=160281 RepID=A0A9P0EQP0_9HYPO|nr:unnamed protein product [Clonostachys solani]
MLAKVTILAVPCLILLGMLLAELTIYHHAQKLAKANISPNAGGALRELDDGEELPDLEAVGESRDLDDGEEVQEPDTGDDGQEQDAEGGQNSHEAALRRRSIYQRTRVMLSHAWGLAISNILYVRFVQYVLAPAIVAIVAGSVATSGFVSVFKEGASVVLRSSSAHGTCQSPLRATVDADIAGTGVRNLAWAQMEVLTGLTFLGHFHYKALGTKEISASLITTHFSLAVALAVQMGAKTLTSADAIVGAMVLDAQASALSITLAAKDVLAARWQVGITIMCQTFGLAVLVTCVTKFGAGNFVGEDSCFCIKTFWWGWVTDCSETTKAVEAATFWVYLVCRMVVFVHGAFFAITNTKQFHLAEKREHRLQGVIFSTSIKTPTNVAEESQSPDSQTSSSQRPDGRAWLRIKDRLPFYQNCPATVTFLFVIHAVFSTTSMLAAHRAMSAGMEPSSGHMSTGQIMPLVIAAATMDEKGMTAWIYLGTNVGKIYFI